jgi:hypothetical protein
VRLLEQADCMRLGSTSRRMREQVLAHLQTLCVSVSYESTDSDVLATLLGLLRKMPGLRELRMYAANGACLRSLHLAAEEAHARGVLDVTLQIESMDAETAVMGLHALRRPVLRRLIVLSPLRRPAYLWLNERFTQHTAAALLACGSTFHEVKLYVDTDTFDAALLTVEGKHCLADVDVTCVHFKKSFEVRRGTAAPSCQALPQVTWHSQQRMTLSLPTTNAGRCWCPATAATTGAQRSLGCDLSHSRYSHAGAAAVAGAGALLEAH